MILTSVRKTDEEPGNCAQIWLAFRGRSQVHHLSLRIEERRYGWKSKSVFVFPKCKPQGVEHYNMTLLIWKGFVERIRKQKDLHNRVVWPYTSKIKIVLAPRNLSMYRLRIVCCSSTTILDHDRNFPVTLWAVSKLANAFILLSGFHYDPLGCLNIYLRLFDQELVYKSSPFTIESWEYTWLGSLLQ